MPRNFFRDASTEGLRERVRVGAKESRWRLTLSLPSSKSTFSQPFKEKCISEVERIGSIITFYLNKLQVLHSVWYHISGEAAGDIWNWGFRHETTSFTVFLLYTLTGLPVTLQTHFHLVMNFSALFFSIFFSYTRSNIFQRSSFH